jgi:tetratricopeptide (TPR) repeat protein
MKSFDIGWVLNLFSSGDTATHDPTTKIKLVCQTFFGTGEVVETRRDTDAGTITIRHKGSTDVNDGVNSNLDSLEPAVGDVVLCIYGRGRVLAVRPEKHQVAVRLSSWRLASKTSSWVTCYLSTEAVQVVGDVKVYEMTVDEKVLYAQAIKEQAAQEFADKDYEGALCTYARAVENMRHVHEATASDNNTHHHHHHKVSVDVLLLTITCSNNAATCCYLLEQWDEAARFARNSLVLIESLEPKLHRNRMLHAILNQSGYTDSKLFGEWRVKSLLTIAQAFAESKKYEQALGIIEEARDVIHIYSAEEYKKQPALSDSIKTLRANEKQAKKLKKVCKEGLKENMKAEQKQQIDALYRSPIRTAAVTVTTAVNEEKIDDDSAQHHFMTPETTRVLNRALLSLAPFPFINLEDTSSVSDTSSVATLPTSPSPKDDKAASAQEEKPLVTVATSSWHLNARTLAGISIVVVAGGIVGLTIANCLISTSRRSK